MAHKTETTQKNFSALLTSVKILDQKWHENNLASLATASLVSVFYFTLSARDPIRELGTWIPSHEEEEKSSAIGVLMNRH